MNIPLLIKWIVSAGFLALAGGRPVLPKSNSGEMTTLTGNSGRINGMFKLLGKEDNPNNENYGKLLDTEPVPILAKLLDQREDSIDKSKDRNNIPFFRNGKVEHVHKSQVKYSDFGKTAIEKHCLRLEDKGLFEAEDYMENTNIFAEETAGDLSLNNQNNNQIGVNEKATSEAEVTPRQHSGVTTDNQNDLTDLTADDEVFYDAEENVDLKYVTPSPEFDYNNKTDDNVCDSVEPSIASKQEINQLKDYVEIHPKTSERRQINLVIKTHYEIKQQDIDHEFKKKMVYYICGIVYNTYLLLLILCCCLPRRYQMHQINMIPLQNNQMHQIIPDFPHHNGTAGAA